MNWIETTLRKGTKSPRICRDMFIADSKGSFKFCQLKNGRMVEKKELSGAEASEMIIKNKLVKRGCILANCFTYRDYQSTKLVDKLLTA
jgi:hypothetical protein